MTLRVLHAISGINLENGGPPVVLHGMAAAQVRAGLDVTVVATWTTNRCPELVNALEGRGVKVVHIGPARNPMSRHPELRGTVERLVAGADVVHVHAMWEQIQHEACRAAGARGVPYVVTPHGMLDSWNMSNTFWGAVKKRMYLRWRMRGHLERAAALHFATEMERDAVARLGLETPTIVEPFGLDGGEFAELPGRGEFRKRYPELGDRKLVLFLGRLDYGKGLELLIPAFAEIAQQRDDVRLVIGGPDSHSGYRAVVERMVDQHGVRGKTVLTGMLRGRERLAALVDAHVLCQPSFHENFGLVVVEALACGTPVVVSDQVYLHPWVSEAGVGGVCGLSVAEVVRELGRWLGDEGLRTRAAGKARGFALGNFDWDVIGGRWVEHYRVIAGSRTRDGASIS